MKTFLKTILTILFVPVFLILLILISIRFQVLNHNFWVATFEKHAVYQNLERIVPNIIDFQTKKDGEAKVDKKIAVALLTKANLKEFFERNITNTLSYVNGESISWMVFIPSQKLPKGFLPNFLLDKEEVAVPTLISFFNRGQEDKFTFISQAALIGKSSWIILTIWTFFTLLILYTLHKVKGASLALYAAGIFTLILIGVVTVMKIAMGRDLLQEGKEPAQLLLGTLAPPIVTEISILWACLGVFLIISGFVLGYLQRPKKLK